LEDSKNSQPTKKKSSYYKAGVNVAWNDLGKEKHDAEFLVDPIQQKHVSEISGIKHTCTNSS